QALPLLGLWWRSQNTYSEFVAHARQMGFGLSRALVEREKPADLLIFPSCDAVQVQALAQYLRLRSASPSPQIVIWLLFAPNPHKSVDDPSSKEQFEEYRQAFADLKAAIDDKAKLAIYCEVAEMARMYSTVTGLEVRVAPGANYLDVSGNGRRRTGGP